MGTKYRPIATAIPGGTIGIAFMVIGLKAYLLQNWKYLSMACTLPYIIVVVPVYFFVPESPRWLHLKQRTDEAMEVMRNMAKWNKKFIPSDVRLSGMYELY